MCKQKAEIEQKCKRKAILFWIPSLAQRVVLSKEKLKYPCSKHFPWNSISDHIGTFWENTVMEMCLTDNAKKVDTCK